MFSSGTPRRALAALVLGALSLLLFMASVHLNFTQRNLPIQAVHAQDIGE